MRPDRVDPHVVLSQDELLTDNKCPVVERSEETVGVVELDTARTPVNATSGYLRATSPSSFT